MNEILGAIKSGWQFALRHIGKILLIPGIALTLAFFIFPYGDLRSVVATTLSRQLGEGVAIDFTEAGLSFGFPIAFKLTDFEFDAPGLPSLAADHLTAKPSLLSIFSQSPAGTIEADGFFESTIKASLSSAGKTKAGASRQNISADIQDLALAPLSEALKQSGLFSLGLQGTINSTLSGTLDPSFEEQPEADVAVQGSSVVIPSSQIPLPGMGPIQTPSLQLAVLDLKAKLSDGKLLIEDFAFGKPNDSLSGRVRGDLGLAFRKDGASTRPALGAFDLRVELNVSKSLMDSMSKSGLALALLVVDKYKSEQAGNLKYAFRVRAAQAGSPPQFERL